MTALTTDLMRETLLIRMAYGDLVGRVCVQGADANSVPLDEVLAGLDAWGLDRYGALLLANRLVDTFEEGLDLAIEVRADWLAKGRRPRTMRQVLSPEERDAVEQLFRRAAAAEQPQPWWKRLRERVSRALIADDELSRKLDEAELRSEGRIP